MSKTIFPFSLNKSGKTSASKKTMPQRPVFSFKENTFSFEIDDQGENFKRTLRRKSFTGETQHPIFRQLSDGRVSIPVEHAEEDSFEDSETLSTSKITQPEPVKVRNTARKKEVDNSVKENKENEVKDTKGKYDWKKYCNELSVEKEPVSMLTNFDSDLNLKEFGDDFKNKLALDTGPTKSEENSESAKLKKEHDLEILKQDEYMKKEYNLLRFHIIPDGNCLYRAVAQATLLDQSQHMELRGLAMDHIREHKEEFKDIIEGSIEDFLLTARLEGEWAGYPEILALSRLLDININITMGGTSSNPNVHSRLHYFETPCKTPEVQTDSKNKIEYFTERQSIWLSWLSNGHYDAFMDKKFDNTAYENWLKSRESRLESDAAIANQIYQDDANRKYLYENVPKYENSYPGASQYTSSGTKRYDSQHLENQNLRSVCNSNVNSQFNQHSSRLSPSFDYASTANISATDYNLDSYSSPRHQYPAATYGRSSPQYPSTPPPAYSTISNTDIDAYLAESLQFEELREASRRRLSPLHYYESDYA